MPRAEGKLTYLPAGREAGVAGRTRRNHAWTRIRNLRHKYGNKVDVVFASDHIAAALVLPGLANISSHPFVERVQGTQRPKLSSVCP